MKYKRLLEGLEVSEILMSELLHLNERFRFDAEFVKKEYLTIITHLQSKPYKRLGDTDIKIIHPAEIKRDFVESGTWFFRTQNLRPLKIEKSNDVYISEKDAARLKNNEIKYGDVLMTRTGANYGQTAVYNLQKTAIASSHVLIFRNSFFNQFFLSTFFNTKYGRKMLDKGMYGAAQPEISPYYILNIPIPLFAEDFQKSIESKFKESEQNRERSQHLYHQAEALLLETIGLKDSSLKGTLKDRVVNSNSLEESTQNRMTNSPPLEGCPQGGVVVNYSEAKRHTQNYMSLPYNPKLKDSAKALRKAGMLHEVLVWNLLKKGGIEGLDFDRQKIIGNYIVDFFCAEKYTVIEIDGSSHNDKIEYDTQRYSYLESLGLEVIHIQAKDVLQRFADVERFLREIFCRKTTTPPYGHPSKGGELATPVFEQPSKGVESQNYNIKTLKESFLKTGRLDAEYYQRKYEEVIDLVKNQDYDLLGNLVSIRKSIEPGSDVYSDEGLPFIRVSDYNKFGISAPAKYLSDKYFKENEQQLTALFPKKETILFSKDGSVGTAYLIQNDMQAVTSGALLHLTVKNKTKILPEYLTLVLNSKVIQKQAERDAGGSVILHWRTSEIENVVVPIVSYQTQHHLTTLIQESFALRTESERLLAEAKEMVEREIEIKSK